MAAAVARASATPVQCAIIGGGVMGASTAWALARRGVPTALIEQFPSEAHAFGSSHGDGRIARLAYAESYYVALMRHAYELWAELERASGVKLMHKCGSLDFGPVRSPNLGELRASYQANGIPFEDLTPDAAMARFPQFRFTERDEIVFQRDGAVLFAGLAVRTLWKAALGHAKQCVIGFRGDPVTGIKMSPQGQGSHTIELASGRIIKAEWIALTAGAWTNNLLQLARLEQLPLVVSDEQVNYFPTRRAASTPDHSIASMPTYISHHFDHTPLGFYGIPNIEGGLDGVKAAVMSLGPKVEGVPAPAARSLATDGALLKVVQGFARDYLPYLNTNAATSLRCLYTSTPDRDFVIGAHPDHADMIVASPCSGHGFKFGPAIGEVMAHRGRSKRHDMGWFHPGRFRDPKLARRTRPAA